MNTQTSLPTAIMSFAFTGVLGPHARPAGYAPTRTETTAHFIPYLVKPR